MELSIAFESSLTEVGVTDVFLLNSSNNKSTTTLARGQYNPWDLFSVQTESDLTVKLLDPLAKFISNVDWVPLANLA